MKTVAIVGWRGMVGSVLMQRLREENDFAKFEPIFCSTSQVGQNGPEIGGKVYKLADGNDEKVLAQADIVVSCQGGDYTKALHPKLRARGWRGYWIDAASTLRMEPNAVIVLDPVNRHVIDKALDSGIKDFIGGNCTVSLMLMALGGLFQKGWVEWISSQTYQAASGTGQAGMKELEDQVAAIAAGEKPVVKTFATQIAMNVIPFIDAPYGNDYTKEEMKMQNEGRRIMHSPELKVNCTCVRVPVMRSHSMAVTLHTKDKVSVEAAKAAVAAYPGVRLIEDYEGRCYPTPLDTTDQDIVWVGRIRDDLTDDHGLTLWCCGDQIRKGAASNAVQILKLLAEKM